MHERKGTELRYYKPARTMGKHDKVTTLYYMFELMVSDDGKRWIGCACRDVVPLDERAQSIVEEIMARQVEHTLKGGL